jgi:hypothetical protein
MIALLRTAALLNELICRRFQNANKTEVSEFAPTEQHHSIMLMKCFSCDSTESADFAFSSCKACRNIFYCSRVCQRENWKEHKQICKSLIVGAAGSMQLKHSEQAARFALTIAKSERFRRLLNETEDLTQFFKHFQESKPGGKKAAASEMKQIARGQEQHQKDSWLLPILMELAHVDEEKLTLPNSPLLVLLELLECMDPTALVGGIQHPSLLNWLAGLMYPDGHHICFAHQIPLSQTAC